MRIVQIFILYKIKNLLLNLCVKSFFSASKFFEDVFFFVTRSTIANMTNNEVFNYRRKAMCANDDSGGGGGAAHFNQYVYLDLCTILQRGKVTARPGFCGPLTLFFLLRNRMNN